MVCIANTQSKTNAHLHNRLDLFFLHPVFGDQPCGMVEAYKVAPPSYKPPYRQRLSGDLLDKVESRIEAAVMIL